MNQSPDIPGPAGGDSSGAAERPPGPRAFNVPPITLGVAAVLVAVFGVLSFAPVPWTVSVIEAFSVRPIRVAIAFADPANGEPLMVALTLVTYALLHLDGMHIALIGGFLLAFGGMCERAFGPRRYVAILLVAALAGAAAKLALDWNAPVYMIGASGAVFGCMGAFIRLLIGGPVHIRRRGLTLLASLVVVNVIFTFAGPAIFGIDGRIAWDAHIGGFLAGLLLGWRPRPRTLRATV